LRHKGISFEYIQGLSKVLDLSAERVREQLALYQEKMRPEGSQNRKTR
jgi:hypothetical protein